MPNTPRVERTCLICNDTFEGTPKATRCKPCREAGLKVPSHLQVQRGANPKPPPKRKPPKAPKPPKPRKTSKPKAPGVPKQRACLECGAKFSPVTPDDRFCPSCTGLLKLDPPTLTGRLTRFDYDKLGEEDKRGFVVDQLTNLERVVVHQINFDPTSDPTPEGYQRMTQRMSETPLGILWVQLCAADGAASSIISVTETPRNLTDEGKVTLLTTFYRLRAKGFHPAVIAKLCPVAILKEAGQEAIIDLPTVTEPHNQTEWDQIVARSQLGLL